MLFNVKIKSDVVQKQVSENVSSNHSQEGPQAIEPTAVRTGITRSADTCTTQLAKEAIRSICFSMLTY